MLYLRCSKREQTFKEQEKNEMSIIEKAQKAEKRAEVYRRAIEAVEACTTNWDTEFYTSRIEEERAKDEPNTYAIEDWENKIAEEQYKNEIFHNIAEQLLKQMEGGRAK